MTVISDMIDDVITDTDLATTLTITRGEDSCVGVAATSQMPDAVLEITEHMATRGQLRDFVIRAADYAPAGDASLPQREDTLTLASGDVYEVFDTENEGPYCYNDTENYSLRIHSRLVSQ